jgi:hypothetical protein
MVLDPAAESGLPDDQVRASLPLSLARARRLLKGGDWNGAMRWLPDLRTRRPPVSEAVIAGLLATYAEIAHYILDLQRRLRGLFWAAPVGSDRDQARGTLLDATRPKSDLATPSKLELHSPVVRARPVRCCHSVIGSNIY